LRYIYLNAPAFAEHFIFQCVLQPERLKTRSEATAWDLLMNKNVPLTTYGHYFDNIIVNKAGIIPVNVNRKAVI
jgi:hypothetical protein